MGQYAGDLEVELRPLRYQLEGEETELGDGGQVAREPNRGRSGGRSTSRGENSPLDHQVNVISDKNDGEPLEDGQVGGVDEEESFLGRSDEETDWEFSLPPLANLSLQTKAMLRRQWLFKKRAWGQTAMEVISPLVMLSLLVLGWGLSEVSHYEEQVYANSTLPILDRVQDIVQNPEYYIEQCTASAMMHRSSLGNLLTPAVLLELAAIASNPGEAFDLSQLLDLATNKQNTSLGALGHISDVDPAAVMALLDCLNITSNGADLVKGVLNFNGPIPIPDFDTFIGAHKLLRLALDTASNGTQGEAAQISKAAGSYLGNLVDLGKIAFAPNSSEVAVLVEHLRNHTKHFNEFYHGTFATEQEGVRAALDHEKQVWALVVVHRMDPRGGLVDYTIRMNYTTVPHTFRKVHRFFRGIRTHYKNYYTSGFLSLQMEMNRYVLERLPASNRSGPFLPSVTHWGVPFPTRKYNHNLFYDAVGPLLGLLMCLSTLYPLGMLVKALVEEKETRARETMCMMGLPPLLFSFSWLVTYLVVFSLLSLLVTALLCSTVLHRSDPSLVFLLFFLFTATLIPFGFFMAVFFSKAKLAAFVAPFLHFGAIMPRYIFFRTSSGQAIPWKSMAAILPPTAFTFGVDLLGQYEGGEQGLKWASVAEDEFSLGRILLILVADFFLYAALAWYLEKVLPSEYGSTLAPWFPFLPSYWLGDSFRYRPVHEPMPSSGGQDVEPVGSGAPRAAISVHGLRKVYPGGKVAVAGLDLEVFEGQITALLGHNGAGKSTTISMLTGLIRPSGGDALIWGRSIRSSMAAVRRVMGVCPQQNVLFPRLSVLEHLELYGALKGMQPDDIPDAANAMLARLGLASKANAFSAALSGGMKRKLQVAIAMLGGSRVVFLDEPTSGMDPHARRAMWDLLRSFRKGRAIVLTTHYMDEADVLADRVAILASGKLRCCGTSLFLKARFGVGYHLALTKGGPSCDAAAVKAIVERHVAGAQPLSTAGGEMAFQLPLAEKAHFAALFKELEEKQVALQVGGYGVSMTTLEEVFLRLASEDQSLPQSLVQDEVALPLPNEEQLAPSPPEKEQVAEGPSLAHEQAVVTLAGEVEGIDSIPSFRPWLDDNASNTDADPFMGQRDSGSSHSAAAEAGALSKAASQEQRIRQNINGRGFRRATTEMFRKRILIARRDIKGLLNSILLPTAVIAFIMLILTLQVNPAGPSLTLDLRLSSPTKPTYTHGVLNPKPRQAIIVSGMKPEKLACLNSSHLAVEVLPATIRDSVGVSVALLASAASYPPHYAALVFNDTVLSHYNFSALLGLNASHAASTNLTEHKKRFRTEPMIFGPQSPYGSALNGSAFQPWKRTRPGQGVKGDPLFNPSFLNPLNSSWHLPTPQHNSTEIGPSLTGTSANATQTTPHVHHRPNSSHGHSSPPPLARDDTLPGSSSAPSPSPSEYSSHVNLTYVDEALHNLTHLNGTRFPPPDETEAEQNAASTAAAAAAAAAGAQRVQEALQNSPLLNTDSGLGLRAPLTIMHNTSSDHALPAIVQEIAQAQMRALLGLPSAQLSARAHPLPVTKKEAQQIETVLSLLAALFVLVPFCYLGGSCAVFVVRERAVKAKHLQLVSGASVASYWVATYVWDFLNYLAIVLMSMVVFVAYRDAAFVGSAVKALATLLLLLLFGASVIPLSYCYSFAFTSHSNAQVAIAGLHFVLGFVTVVASIIMKSIDKTKALNAVLVHFYRLFPPFNFGEGLISLSAIDLAQKFTGQKSNPFDWNVVGRPLSYMAFEAAVYFLLVLIIDLDVFATLGVAFQYLKLSVLAYLHPLLHYKPVLDSDLGDWSADEDADVAAERKRVTSGAADGEAIVVHGLRKVYPGNGRDPPKTAVADLCLGIPGGQCFGFLGVNGAGKTTTLAILTGDLRATAGDAFVNGASVRRQLAMVQSQIGYCPQFDPLLDLLTGREHLSMFARLKGVAEDEVEAAVEEAVAAVGLEPHADRCSGTYSGGNKRKLSLAIALVGNPAAVFLDEPSSGMDPVARRAMWRIITEAAASRGTSVVLTTHSMEECEALCSRVAVMAAGRLVCLGSPQHLKSRFGEGYYVEMRAAGDAAQTAKVARFLQQTFPGADLDEEHMGRTKWRLPMKGLSLSRVFGAIEAAKDDLGIEDYSVSQSTLEQVFLSFARNKER